MTSHRITVRVSPGAKRTGLSRRADGTLKVAVTEKATDGRANRAVVEFIAAALEIPKSRVHIASGEHSRTKIIEIQEISSEELNLSITKALQS